MVKVCMTLDNDVFKHEKEGNTKQIASMLAAYAITNDDFRESLLIALSIVLDVIPDPTDLEEYISKKA